MIAHSPKSGTPAQTSHKTSAPSAPPAERPRTSDEIIADIAQTRHRLDRTLDALGRKLSPTNLAQEAAHAFKHALGMRSVTKQRVRASRRKASGDGASTPEVEIDSYTVTKTKGVMDVLADATAAVIEAAIAGKRERRRRSE